MRPVPNPKENRNMAVILVPIIAFGICLAIHFAN